METLIYIIIGTLVPFALFGLVGIIVHLFRVRSNQYRNLYDIMDLFDDVDIEITSKKIILSDCGVEHRTNICANLIDRKLTIDVKYRKWVGLINMVNTQSRKLVNNDIREVCFFVVNNSERRVDYDKSKNEFILLNSDTNSN